MKTIKEFFKQHGSDFGDERWALARCSDMLEVWALAPSPLLCWLATRPGVLSDDQLAKYALWCAGRVEHLIADKRFADALHLAKRVALGSEPLQDLTGALERAREADTRTWNARDYAARAGSAARAAAEVVYGLTDFVTATESEAQCAACAHSSYDAESEDQAAWLRANVTPDFN